MKAALFRAHGGVENIEIAEIEKPQAKSDEALIRVRAVALNGFDPMILESIPGIKTPLPMIPGGDVVGEIEEVGDAVSRFKPGDRVMVDPVLVGRGVLGESVCGGACEYIAIPESNLVSIPDGVSWEDAAALPIAYGTAHRMMVTHAQVAAGQKVLILGATGGVGVCAVQIAKAAGAEVMAGTTSDEKAAMLRELGADHIVNVAKQDFFEEVKRVWGKPRVFGESGGADILINFLGGNDWAKGLKCVTRGGKVLTCGATNGFDPKTDLRYIWSFELKVLGSNSWAREDLTALLEKVRSGELKPVISAVRPLDDLALSLQSMIDRKTFGKEVILVP